MRIKIGAFFLFCFLSLPALAWGVGVEVNSAAIHDNLWDNYGGAVMPQDVFQGGKKGTIPDLLDDDDSSSDGRQIQGIADPIEGWNRLMFRFNDKAYTWVLRPVTNVYSAVLPSDVRGCIDNFFLNLSSPVRMVNSLLQGRFKDAGAELSRFAINSTIGVAGLADVAAIDFGIARHRADFGQTLGHYGVGGGMFICWPFLGPSTLRDSVGLVVDTAANPTTYVNKTASETITVNSVQMVNKLSVSPDIYGDLKKISIDPYIAMRQGYIDYRRALIEGEKKTSMEKKK
jgi:phospholipid-binding lipoprotein MlaA